MEIKVRQKCTRMLAGKIPMAVVIESIDKSKNTFMVNTEKYEMKKGHGWTFDIKTGIEIDHYLGWGPQYKRVGSFIKEITKVNDKNEVEI